jgi:hypothetical protein
MGWIDFFENCELVGFLKVVYLSLDATYQILLNSFCVFSPDDFKNRMMGVAKNLQNENTRPINSVDLAHMQ